MKIKIVKEKRKTLLLKIVSTNEILVKAPQKLGDDKIQNFISSKEKWVKNKVKKMEELKEFANNFDFSKYIYKFGKPILKTENLSIDFNKFTSTKKNKIIKQQYLSMFDLLKEKTQEFGKKFGITFKDVRSCTSTCKWGSCTSNAEIRLNYKLIILPEEIIDYVIIHELCHTKHMNHKPQFWKEVEKYCPNHKLLQQKIKAYSFVLKKCSDSG